jgi:hypothetical protein
LVDVISPHEIFELIVNVSEVLGKLIAKLESCKFNTVPDKSNSPDVEVPFI